MTSVERLCEETIRAIEYLSKEVPSADHALAAFLGRIRASSDSQAIEFARSCLSHYALDCLEFDSEAFIQISKLTTMASAIVDGRKRKA